MTNVIRSTDAPPTRPAAGALLPVAWLTILAFSGCTASQPEGRPGGDLLPITEFIQTVYVSGVPYEQAIRYDSSVLPEIEAMLTDPSRVIHWENAVVAYGMIARDRDVHVLTGFVGRDRGAFITPDEYGSVTAAIVALGYTANRRNSNTALEYLTSSLNPTVWASRGVRWQSPYGSDVERNIELSRMAIIGLALSGNPEAGDVLRRAMEDSSSVWNREEEFPFMTMILEEHAAVQMLGLAGYIERIESRSPQP